ncbi:MAG TPA: glycosyltransferase family 4 protein [Nitrospira sp.]|nr:glycosyltransferase family 4 protein [Nitrospira sp.]
MGRTILFIHGIGEIGGAERDLHTLVGGLNRSQWEPAVACPAAGPLLALFRQAGATVVPLDLAPWRKWTSFVARRSSVERLKSVIRDLRPSVIHVNDIWWVPHVLRARSGMERPVPVAAHVRQEIEPGKAGRYELDRVDAVIAISRHVEQALASGGVKPEKIRMIYSGIRFGPPARPAPDRAEVRSALGLSEQDVLVGTVANVFPRKGYHVMLRALPAMIEAVPALHYAIAGTEDSAYVRSLRQLVHELGLEGRVHFAGFQDPVQPFVAALDLYVHPALMEGFGIAVAEAMAWEKAVVATRTGGLPEIVEHEHTGLLVDPGNIDQLSQAVIELLRDRTRREEFAKQGAVKVRECFAVEKAVAATERVYHELTGMDPG